MNRFWMKTAMNILIALKYFYNVRGDLSFNIANGFYSGLQIEDLSERGFEKTNKFCISSFEQDNNCLLYCEYIKIELI